MGSSGARVGIVIGSSSDASVAHEAVRILEELGIPYEQRVISAHRTPREAAAYAETARERGLSVLIAVAGLSAHLPGVLAAYTTLPVIGVPVDTGPLHGFDALMAMAQMPTGVPVATVGIGNARNAALLAASILAVSDPVIAGRLAAWREKQAERVRQADEELQD
ncbi:MAG: 5-(carboxyamino)imidazole ribonucleotide mutase [Limnochordales bacterium]|nr:5-(carboxyamino)imidazole ribonucleotide mutase [Limnochordales bacterium]